MGPFMKGHLLEHISSEETYLFKVAETVSCTAAFQLNPPFDVMYIAP